MSASDYATIRDRLDRPQVVVWDGCAETLARPDGNWPGPFGRKGVAFLVERLPARTLVRLAVIATSDAIRAFECAYPHDLQPRGALELLWAWLQGDSVSATDLHDAHGVLDYAYEEHNYLHHAGKSACDLLQAAEHAELGCDYQRSCGFWSGWAVAYAAGIDADDVAVSMRKHDRFYRWWWARCRAVLPIADVRTAEIEWGAIELPRRPEDTDLPSGR